MRFQVYFACTAALLVSTTTLSAQSVREGQLVAAAQDCRPAEVSDLLAQGVDPDAANSGGWTALMMAANYGCEEAVRLLLASGADIALRHPDFGDAAALAKMNRHPRIQAMIAAGSKAAPAPATAPRPASPPAATAQAAPPPRGGAAGASNWPKLGHYKVGQQVLYSGSGGKTWYNGVIKSIDPQYGYNLEGVTGSEDAYFVVGTEREPFWTGYFIGDWRVSVPMAMGTVTDGRNVYRTVGGGLRLPPLRIDADGSYSWRVQEEGGERLIRGRWEPNPKGPGVILKNAERGADWLVYNNSRTGSTLGETVILSSECCSHYDGSRLK